jgi:hypothetical protein
MSETTRGPALSGLILAALAAGLSPAVAQASPEEAQVYMDELNRPGDVGLDIHMNYAAKGRTVADYPGQRPSDGRLRLTPEFSYGLTPNLELGLYLPLADLDRRGRLAADGAKVRIKFIAPKAQGQDWFWGANLEVGRVDRRLDINPWNAELKTIWGIRKGPWTLAANGNLDWVVSGPGPKPTTFEADAKVSYQLHEGLALGVETYNDLGGGRDLGRLSAGDQRLFLVIDKSLGRWDLNLGAGYGYGAPEDKWVVKAIIGVPIGG